MIDEERENCRSHQKGRTFQSRSAGRSRRNTRDYGGSNTRASSQEARRPGTDTSGATSEDKQESHTSGSLKDKNWWKQYKQNKYKQQHEVHQKYLQRQQHHHPLQQQLQQQQQQRKQLATCQRKKQDKPDTHRTQKMPLNQNSSPKNKSTVVSQSVFAERHRNDRVSAPQKKRPSRDFPISEADRYPNLRDSECERQPSQSLRYLDGCRPKERSQQKRYRSPNMSDLNAQELPCPNTFTNTQCVVNASHKQSYQNTEDRNSSDNQRALNNVLTKEQIHILLKEDPKKICLEITSSEDRLTKAVKQCTGNNDYLETFLRVVSKSFKSDSFSVNSLENVLLRENFFGTLQVYFMKMISEIESNPNSVKLKLKLSRASQDAFTILFEQSLKNKASFKYFSDLFIILRLIINTPGMKQDLPQQLIKDCQDYAEQKILFDRTRCKTEMTSGKSQHFEDFRTVNVLPSCEEIKGQVQPFIRKNIVDGDYEDTDHYLDVQFRLLREDFIGPLRDGLVHYIKNAKSPETKQNKNRNSDVRVYKEIRVVCPVINGDHGLCFRMSMYMTPGLRQVKWSLGKKLIFGSLVCLSDNDFETIHLATVIDNDKIQEGKFVVHFEDDTLQTRDIIGRSYCMAESTAFFESYKHVLHGLKTFHEGGMPFERHLVFCETHVRPPSYVNDETTFDLFPLTDRYSKIGRDNYLDRTRSVKLLNTSKWPNETELKVDKSQLTAIKHALTKEFVIIQGPPGTGKTYIGLKIAKALLHNKTAWCNRNPVNNLPENSPLLVVCYTNHALDQFLEGIQSFHKDNIVRVGGRSTSASLDHCSIKQKRRGVWGNASLSKDARDDIDRKRTDLIKLVVTIDVILKNLLHERHLSDVMEQAHFTQLTERESSQTTESCIATWLGMDSLESNCRRQCCTKRHDRSGTIQVDDQHRSALLMFEDVMHNEDVQKVTLMQRKVGGEFTFHTVENTRLTELTKHENDLEIQKSDKEHQHLINMDKLQREIDTIHSKCKNENNENRKQHYALTAEQNSCQKKHDREMKALDKEIGNTRTEIVFENEIEKEMVRSVKDNIQAADQMSDSEEAQVNDVWKLPVAQRWRLYRKWIKQKCESIYNAIDERKADFQVASERLKEARMLADQNIIAKSSVIGMTTTCAARYISALKEIGPKVVIVEEAAEVLEAHIVTALSQKCEHLILIGDHKQLRPNPTVYRLAVKFNLDISLFERMIKNNVPYVCLEQQHRMRPEIANIVRFIYPHLRDHKSVFNYARVKGMEANMQCINHSEMESFSDGLRSYSNPFEAEFAVALCDYLLKQGYGCHQITVLTTYTGQLLEMQRRMPKVKYDRIKVTVVDNYQGEENDIVILSLVRSNNEERIGFLKTENRICVALSRAKIGFFLLGNFTQLARCSPLWSKIYNYVQSKGVLSTGLKTKPENHPVDKKHYTKIKDFEQSPQGCCSRDCDARLECGHTCDQKCHVIDPDHEAYRCHKPCAKMCENNHPCKSKCYEKCPDCQIKIKKILPQCGHNQIVPCYLDPGLFQCEVKPCTRTLKCGHPCPNACGDEHASKCLQHVRKTWNCGHTAEVNCWKKDEMLCPVPCEGILKCGHRCAGTCSSCFGGVIHKQCTTKCERILVCGHMCTSVCEDCPPCQSRCENRCQHNKCTKSCGEPCAPCQEPCTWVCVHSKCTKKCSEPCNRPPCNKPCNTKLQCGHSCIGLCGEPCPELCRVCNHDEITEVFFGDEDEPNALFVRLDDCGHIIEYKALDRYMSAEDDSSNVQLKGCPRCKTPVRKCSRYGTQINQRLNDIEMVKRAIVGNTKHIREQVMRTLKDNLSCYNERRFGMGMTKGTGQTKYVAKTICDEFLVKLHEFSTRIKCMTQQNYEVIKELQRVVTVIFHGVPEVGPHNDEYVARRKGILQAVCRPRLFLSAQEASDIERELRRRSLFKQYTRFQTRVERRNYTNNVVENRLQAMAILVEVKDIILGDYVLSGEQEIDVEDKISTVKYLFKKEGIDITEEERKQIVAAIGLKRGHWFKCPNNHVYCIGECGGANQKSKCPECGAEIGGQQHRLTEGNRLAPEMDGAPFAAFSEEANNLGNFNLADLH